MFVGSRTSTENGNLNNLYILELFHGPTFAFKDVALQVVGNLFEYFLSRKARGPNAPKQLTVIAATSGDTGSAAIFGLRGKKGIEVFILHPQGRVSPVQEAQMTTVLDPNVHNLAVQGSFDDCQEIVKTFFGDKEFQRRLGKGNKLAAVNSINWARILSQTVYYFYAYFQVLNSAPLPSPDALPTVQFSVPTGNFGDVLAGYYAKRMGLPIHNLIIATNSNDILYRFLQTGSYTRDGVVKETLSPAMDILISSNFERLLWCAALETLPRSKRDAKTASKIIHSYMNQLKATSSFKAHPKIHKYILDNFTALRVTDSQTSDAIRRYYDSPKPYILDPHTAVGVVAAEKLTPAAPDIETVCLATAHPGKFPSAIFEALGNKVAYKDFAPKEMLELEGKEKRVIVIESGGSFEKTLELVKKEVLSLVSTQKARL